MTKNIEASGGSLTHEQLGSSELSFSQFQTNLAEIYTVHNAEMGYGPDTQCLKLVGNAGTLKKAAEKGQGVDVVSNALSNTFSWLGAMANSSDLSFQDVLEEKYGNGCPRCHNIPCSLAEGTPCSPTDIKIERDGQEMPTSITDWQQHLGRIYPNNLVNVTLQQALANTANRVVDETIELISSTQPDVEREQSRLSQFHNAHDKEFPWRGEFADVLAWGMAVATVLNRMSPEFSLEKYLKDKYEKGCPYCKMPFCQCARQSNILDTLRITSIQLPLTGFAEESTSAT